MLFEFILFIFTFVLALAAIIGVTYAGLQDKDLHKVEKIFLVGAAGLASMMLGYGIVAIGPRIFLGY